MKSQRCIKKSMAFLIVGLLFLMVQGCGFNVRTAELDSLGFSEVNLSCDKQNAWDLCQTLERELDGHNVALSSEAQHALEVFDISSKERVFTIDLDATADEYELTRSLAFSLSDLTNESSKYTNQVSARRIYRHNSDALLAKDREREAITKSLDTSLALEIIRQLTLIRLGN